MDLWTTMLDVAQLGVATARGALRFGERIAPWPLSLVPRVLRLPLDVAASLVADSAGRSPTPPEPGEARDRKPERSPVRAPVSRRRAPEHDDEYEPARTATIAGTRSEGPDDAPRYDREFRSRLAPLYTRDAGRGAAIVLLHAFPLSSRMWEPQLAALAGDFRVVAPDLAGFGLSWVPDASLSLDEQARALEITLDDLRVDEMVLVGLSMGGYVAFPLLARLGDRVRGLVLAHTRAAADDQATANERHRLAAEVLRDGVDVAASELLPKLLGKSTAQDHPELVDHVHALILENKEAGVAGALRAMASRRDATAQLGRIRCPVLVVAGEQDVVVSRAAAHEMAGRIRDAHLAVLLAGHLSNLEAPEEFNRMLAQFARSSLRAGKAAPRTRAAHG